MCDCCQSEERNFKFSCGRDAQTYSSTICKAHSRDRGLTVSLCQLCNIELFCKGERTFLQNHPLFAQTLGPKALRKR